MLSFFTRPLITVVRSCFSGWISGWTSRTIWTSGTTTSAQHTLESSIDSCRTYWKVHQAAHGVVWSYVWGRRIVDLSKFLTDWACIPTTSYDIKIFRLKSGLGKRETSKLREMWSRSRWSGQCLVCPWIDWVLPGSDALSHLRVDFEAQLSFSSEEGLRFSWHPHWWNHHWLASRIVHAACMPTAFFGWNMLKLPIYSFSFHLFSSLFISFPSCGGERLISQGTTHVAQAFQGDPYRPCLVLRPEVARRERGRQGETEDVRRPCSVVTKADGG